MQLVVYFSVLLRSLFLVVCLLDDAKARPYRRDAGMVHLPLKRVEQARSDLQPQVLLQQHINRGIKRLARMTGREPPSDLELRENLRKRMFIPPGGRKPPGGKREELEKRFGRDGTVPLDTAGSQAGSLSTSPPSDLSRLSGVAPSLSEIISALNEIANDDNRSNNVTNNGDNGDNNNGAAISGDGVADTLANSTSTDMGATSVSSNSTGEGVPQANIDAAADGGLTAAEEPTADNSLGLQIEANDLLHIATIQLGTPGADFNLVLDSGSADFWTGAENCQSATGGDCGAHQFLGPQSSSSFVDTGDTFEVIYGTGAVSGNIVTDNVNIAGLSLSSHTFGVATNESDNFVSDLNFDGIMGLAQSALSRQGVLTPVEALAQSGQISAAITSYKLGRVADGVNDGQVTFGGLDTSRFDQATLTTIENQSQAGFWEGAIDAVTVDGQDIGLSGRTAILDTGTTVVLAPPDDAAALHSLIPGAQSDGQGGFTIPCTTTAQIAMSFGGRSFTIDTRDVLFLPVDENDPTGDCFSNISGVQIGGATQWLVGGVLLKNVYFSTNVDENIMQLANLV